MNTNLIASTETNGLTPSMSEESKLLDDQFMRVHHSPLKIDVQHFSERKYKFINTDYLLEISSGDPEFIVCFLKTFIVATRRSLQNLQSDLLNSNLLRIEKTAHAMKAAGTYIGSNMLTILVSRLERAAHNLDRTQVTRLVPQIQIVAEDILQEIEEYLAGSN